MKEEPGVSPQRERYSGRRQREEGKEEEKLPWDFVPSGKLGSQNSKMEWGKRTADDVKKEEPPKEMEKPCFEPSGKLAADTNTYKGVVIKYNEPPEAKIPKVRWRLYQFKGDDHLPVIYVHRQSAYLIGRDRKIADFPVDHPSCSKQHAALQYRSMPYERADGSRGRRTRPYIIDLKSGNGTYLNGERIEPQRYVELKEKDVLKFGFSTREFVVLNENSAEEYGDAGSDSEEEKFDLDIASAEARKKDEDEDDLF